ncbi:MAG: virion morphogenesis protein [Alphaproteobacteria bacterium HGW-Alphaproteobacteria-2]|nr:MAG: virion morphogenesis protein [Alphaproteobacteria bacterium HGW-Alphaproteobacteria-2]
MADTVAGILGRPFPEQVAAFRLRLGNLVPTRRWDDISGAAHDRAFMVAGATKADLLADLAGAVDKAISEGRGLEEFRRDFREIVTRRGWHGWTGEGTRRGEAWRTRVIYRTNMATTYAAGRAAQLVEGGFDFWVYRHGGSREPRPEHLSWNGITLPPDHPWWQTHYPPNGWGCSCFVLGARSEAGARRLGGDPGKPLPPGWDDTNPRTGAPPGIDRGWNHAPGRGASDAILSLRDRLDELPERPAIDLIQSWIASDAFGRWLADPRGNWPLVRLPEADARRIGAKKTVADMSAATAAKQLREHPEITAGEYLRAQSVVDAPTRVIPEGPRNLIYVQEIADAVAGGHVLIVKATRTGSGVFVTSFRRLSRRDAARDAELRRLLNKGG